MVHCQCPINTLSRSHKEKIIQIVKESIKLINNNNNNFKIFPNPENEICICLGSPKCEAESNITHSRKTHYN